MILFLSNAFSQLQQLQQLQNQQRQLGLEQQRQRQLGLVTLERIGTAVSVIQKREEKSKFVILPQETLKTNIKAIIFFGEIQRIIP